MQNRRRGEEEKRRKGERASSLRLLFSSSPLLLFSSSICFMAGCESGWGSREPGDPFLGIRSTPKATQTAAAASNASIPASSGPLPPMPPPMPASYSAAGTAPVAGGETPTPENPRELRIVGNPVSPASLPSAGSARGAAPAVNIGNPEPAPIGAPANSTTTPAPGGLGAPSPASTPSGNSAANIRTYEDAQKFLKQHGVTWQRMSGDGDDWRFSCGIPNPSNPHINKTYQTSRPFPDLLSALRAVIAQIEQMPH